MVGIEHIQQLADLSIKNLNKGFSEELKANRIKIVCGDGRLGYEPEAPYDVIHVGAAAPTIPEALTEQLAIDGVLVIPVGKYD